VSAVAERTEDAGGLSQRAVVLMIVLLLSAVVAVGFVLQAVVEQGALSPVAEGTDLKSQREIDKLDAEIRQIRSDTGGSLFWLKLAGVFVTVGTAVGGYLLGQTRTTRERVAAERRTADRRLEFDHRQSVDDAYQAIVRELSAESALLRAAAAMKLGKLLESPPVEWHVDDARTRELSGLTKQVLAASLAIEREPKVLKALTIAIGLHGGDQERGDLRGLDLSGARAADAYWARIDFTYADFYKADLTRASLRKSDLSSAQFRETTLYEAVLGEAECDGANFKFADLRHADLRKADLRGARFEGAKVFGAMLEGALVGDNPQFDVDASPAGDGSQLTSVATWLTRASAVDPEA
jgi:hypothetical protein